MRTSPPTNVIAQIRAERRTAVRPNYVATPKLMLMLLAEGQDVTRITRSAGWPARRIHVFAGRHGYLFASDGVPYKPPVLGEQPRSARRTVRSQS